MKSIKFLKFMMAAAMVCLFAGCSDKDDAPVNEDNQQEATIDVDGIVMLTRGIVNWDEAYVTSAGYFCYSNDINKLVTASRATGDATSYHMLTQMSAAGKVVLTLLLNENLMPAQIDGQDWTLYFCYLNDETVELVLEKEGEMTLLGTVTFDAAGLKSLINDMRKDNNLQTILAYIVELLKKQDGGELPAEIKAVLEQYAELLKLDINDDVNIDDLKLPVNEDGDYEFAGTSQTVSVEVIVDVTYSIALWTGNASFKVGGSSCTLGGAVFCASPSFNDYGRYGILVDTDPENLTIGTADYEVLAYQGEDEASFEVDFRGFKPNTTYYYRAFYVFNSTNHGSLSFKYGKPNAQEGYDSVIKSFTTGDNNLSVDVVMCIDVTGSMSGIINTVKANALAFYDLFKERCDAREINLTGLNSQVIAFADINVDGDRALNMSPVYSMPSQQTELKEYVDKLYASGGGDAPESALEALDLAFDKEDWGEDDGYHRQVVILWTDAPYLVGSSYTALTAEMVETKWNSMPSGRRMIIFGPDGSSSGKSGYWNNMQSWVNTVVNFNYAAGFDDFGYSLDMIIDELTSRSKSQALKSVDARGKFYNNYPANN